MIKSPYYELLCVSVFFLLSLEMFRQVDKWFHSKLYDTIAQGLGKKKRKKMIHSANPQSLPTDWRTTCVNIVITIGQDCGRPRGSKKKETLLLSLR